jgi:hypothetical protein
LNLSFFLRFRPRRLVEGVGDGLVDVFLQLLVVLNAPLALLGNIFTDVLRGGLTIDPSDPSIVGPVQVLGILATATGRLAAFGMRGGDCPRKDGARRGNDDFFCLRS